MGGGRPKVGQVHEGDGLCPGWPKEAALAQKKESRGANASTSRPASRPARMYSTPDAGWLEDAEIVPVRDRESGLIVAMAREGGTLPPLAEGQEVRSRIDLQLRMTHAALHSAGHLVEAAGRMQGWEMVGSIHFPGQARIEFQVPQADGRVTDPEGREEVTAELRAAVEAAIADDLPVTARHLTGGRRVVHLGELHAAPCGGTHVRSLGDLDDVVLPALKVKKGRIRVSYTAAHRSL